MGRLNEINKFILKPLFCAKAWLAFIASCTSGIFHCWSDPCFGFMSGISSLLVPFLSSSTFVCLSVDLDFDTGFVFEKRKPFLKPPKSPLFSFID